jgi:transposase
LRQLPPGTVVLFEEETILRLFPPLRATWAYVGEQAVVRITGRKAKRVLFGAINPWTGHRIVLRRGKMRQADFQAFLWLLRHHYGRRPLALLVDRGPSHEAAKSQELAAALQIELLWLPKQCSELNAMDHLWKELKRVMAANRQFRTIDEGAAYAENWILNLGRQEALRKAGVLSKNFWLRHL